MTFSKMTLEQRTITICRRAARHLLPCLGGLLAVPIVLAADPQRPLPGDEEVPPAAIEQDLKSRHPVYLEQMLNDPEARAEYIEKLGLSQRIERAIGARGLVDDQQLLEGLRNARERLLLDALVRDTLADRAADIEALAKERYDANPEDYKTRKKIKIAVIFIKKDQGQAAKARTEIEEIAAQLAADPQNQDLFHELAKAHSDDIKAPQGGVIDKWLIAPEDLQDRDALMQAAFALEAIGAVTDIVESRSGFALARLLAATPSQQLPYDRVKGDIITDIQTELYRQTMAELLQALTPEHTPPYDDALLTDKISEALRQRSEPSQAQ